MFCLFIRALVFNPSYSVPLSSSHHALPSPAPYAFTCDLCLPTVWRSEREKLWQTVKRRESWRRRRRRGRVCSLSVLCLQKDVFFFFHGVEILFGLHPWINSPALKKMSDTLLNMIIDWTFRLHGQRLSPRVQVRLQLVRGIKCD